MKIFSRSLLAVFAIGVSGLFAALNAQTPAVKPTVITGDVISIETGKIILQT